MVDTIEDIGTDGVTVGIMHQMTIAGMIIAGIMVASMTTTGTVGTSVIGTTETVATMIIGTTLGITIGIAISGAIAIEKMGMAGIMTDKDGLYPVRYK
jgi:hypothetical protein